MAEKDVGEQIKMQEKHVGTKFQDIWEYSNQKCCWQEQDSRQFHWNRKKWWEKIESILKRIYIPWSSNICDIVMKEIVFFYFADKKIGFWEH
jgi:hypothetical protein